MGKEIAFLAVFALAVVLLSGCISDKPGNSTTPLVTLESDNNKNVPKQPENLCGNNTVNTGETCSSCPSDVKCGSAKVCCSGSCIKPACSSTAYSSSTECNDNDNTTIDECKNPGTCSAVCKHNQITTCTDGDSVCPSSCNVFNDNDCKGLTPGTLANSGNLQITVSNPHIEVCTFSYSDDKDAYLVFELSAENKGTKEEFISSSDFKAVDPNRKQFDGSFMSYPLVMGGNCENAKNDAFDSGNLLPGSKNNGKIWIELSSTGDYAKGKWYIFRKEMFGSENDYVVYEAQIIGESTSIPTSCGSGEVLQNNACVSCGSKDEPCCGGNKCVVYDCINNFCRSCGGQGEQACPTSGCSPGHELVNGNCVAECGLYQIRQNGQCVACGGENQIPCGDGCQYSYELSNDVCIKTCLEGFEVRQNGACVSCGTTGAPCCTNNKCLTISVCQNNTCVKCGNLDDPCCENNKCYLGTCTDGLCKSPY